MPYLSPDWWEVPQVGHSSYQTHPQAALRAPTAPQPFASALLHGPEDLELGREEQCFHRRKPLLALLLKIYIFSFLLVQTELKNMFRNPSEGLCVHLSPPSLKMKPDRSRTELQDDVKEESYAAILSKFWAPVAQGCRRRSPVL